MPGGRRCYDRSKITRPVGMAPLVIPKAEAADHTTGGPTSAPSASSGGCSDGAHQQQKEQQEPKARLLHLRDLERGAYGSVSLVRWTDPHNTKSELRVVKRMPNKAQRQVSRELEQIERNCVHPNVVKYYRHYRTPDHTELLMELMDLGSLDKLTAQMARMEKEKELNEGMHRADVATCIAYQLFMALDYFHNFHGGLHRDIKPGNILVHSNGRVKICDFDTSVADGMPHYTGVGTESYLAPEVVRNEGQTPAVDIWSAGVVIFQIATGIHPYASTSANGGGGGCFEFRLGVPSAEKMRWEAAKTLPDELQDLLRCCLQDDPQKRISASCAMKHAAFKSIVERQSHDSKAEREVELQGVQLYPSEDVLQRWKRAITATFAGPTHNHHHSEFGEATATAVEDHRQEFTARCMNINNLMKNILYNWEYGAVKWLREWFAAHKESLHIITE